jgi:hypothetical protein
MSEGRPPGRARARIRGALTGMALAAVIVACLAGPPEVAKAQVITFPGIPPAKFEAHVEIEASPQQVWTILTNFSAYPIWNPFIYPVVGEARQGTTLEITIHPGTRSITYQVAVVAVQPNRELTWSGLISSPVAFESTYRFTIEPLAAGRVRLAARESHKGVLAILEWSFIYDIRNGLDAMAKSIRNRAELERIVPPPLVIR